MNKIKTISIAVLFIITIVFGVLLFKKKEKIITVEVPVKIEVPVPGKKGKSDTIYLPSETKVNPINKDLLKKFKESEDKLRLYEEAITEHVYEEIFEDSTQSITVSSNVRGTLLKQSLEYEIYPYTIHVDTVIKTEVKIEGKRKILVGGQVGIPILNKENTPVFQGNIMFQNKKDNIFSIGIDTRGFVFAGYNIKL